MKILLVAMLAVNAWGMESSERQIENLNARIFTMVKFIKTTLKERDERKLRELLKKLDEILEINNERKPNKNLQTPLNKTQDLSPIQERSLEESRVSIIHALNEI
jgi:hypothetical protein